MFLNLTSAALCLAAILLAGFASPCLAQAPGKETSKEQPQQPQDVTAHVVNRLSYGPFPGEIERVKSMGLQAYIDSQLDPQSLPEPQALKDRLAALKTASMDTVQLFRTYGPKAPGGPRPHPTIDEINSARAKAAIIAREAAEAKLWRAILSPRQLEELLCDFWYNHFNVPAAKGLAHLWVGSYEREAIRPFVLGKFEDMLQAVTRHPAMLIYLENWQSSSPESATGKGQQRPLTELHARELLAAHTFGPDAVLKPQDVTSLAMILAGWSIGAPRGQSDKNGFLFDEKRHDNRDKTFLGATIKGAGMAEGVEALHMLALHPQTAKNVCTKLARFFVADDPPKPLVESLTKTYLDTKGDLRQVTRALLTSQEFLGAKYAGTKFKNPLRYVASIVRASDRGVGEVRSLEEILEWLGMPLYDAPGTSGFKDVRDGWLSAESLVNRLDLAAMAGKGALSCWVTGPCGPPAPLDAEALLKTMGLNLTPVTRQALDAAPAQLKAAVLLGSPEGQQY
ncbi:DUF1800 domain-containing protein [Fundidesulfovibrio agrisoli]|uniref:DUF1800 domain-containing protein n=1 Tax=Fundidesulfovibrio agrisoli TaxID=2922717 RepID=UPI001FAD20EA|nr:DUF1800 domain-containing protein [Fundidesulfovibrio agrisoli]